MKKSPNSLNFTRFGTTASALLSVTLLCCVRSKTTAESGVRVVGGDSVNPTHPGFESAVAIVYENPKTKERQVACSGVLVSKDISDLDHIIYTAAHCLIYDKSYFPFIPVAVYFAGSENKETEWLSIQHFWTHPQYTEKLVRQNGVEFFNFDTAALLVKGALSPSRKAVEILPRQSPLRQRLQGQILSLTGFGQTIPGQNTSTGRGMTTQGRFKEAFDSIFVVYGSTQGKMTDTCEGDSGGPAYVRENESSPWYLLGILSTGTAGCFGSWSTYTDAVTVEGEKIRQSFNLAK